MRGRPTRGGAGAGPGSGLGRRAGSCCLICAEQAHSPDCVLIGHILSSRPVTAQAQSCLHVSPAGLGGLGRGRNEQCGSGSLELAPVCAPPFLLLCSPFATSYLAMSPSLPQGSGS